MSNPAPTSDIADLLRRAGNKAGMLRMGERIAFGSDADMIDELATALAAQQAEIERLRAQVRTIQNAAKTLAAAQGSELEHLRQNHAFDHRLREEHESLIAGNAQLTNELLAAESALAARDETIRGLRERVRRLAHLANTGDSPKARAERAAERARTTLNSTEPFDD